jgi:hypothetical protein
MICLFGCGSVYLVKDLKSQTKAALKAEPNIFGSFLKFEVHVLNRMQGRGFVAKLINAGKKTDYSYMVSMNCTQLLFISIFRS